MKQLTFDTFSETNLSRAARWHGNGKEGGIAEWSPTDWSAALGGEVGELHGAVLAILSSLSKTSEHAGYLLDITKKLKRYADGIKTKWGSDRDVSQLLQDAADEAADVLIYLDLTCQRLGISLADAVVSKFNRVSDKTGFPEKLPVREVEVECSCVPPQACSNCPPHSNS